MYPPPRSGGDLLEQLLREGRAMAEKRVVRDVVLPTLTALAHLHAAGIIHRCACLFGGKACQQL